MKEHLSYFCRELLTGIKETLLNRTLVLKVGCPGKEKLNRLQSYLSTSLLYLNEPHTQFKKKTKLFKMTLGNFLWL